MIHNKQKSISIFLIYLKLYLKTIMLSLQKDKCIMAFITN
nr:MAG TPA: hypothetical protein [Caudoviricetes sp.]